jgi:membrane-associated phospholipid phosphatase
MFPRAVVFRKPSDVQIDTSAFWVLIVLFVVIGVWSKHSDMVFVDVEFSLFFILSVLGISLCCGFVAYGRLLAQIGYYIGVWLGYALVGSLVTYLTARWSFPLQDDVFMQMDLALGFDWMAWLTFLTRHPTLNEVLKFAYQSLGWQPILAIVYFTLKNKPSRNSELFWIALISVIFNAFIAGLLPARGTFDQFHISNSYSSYLSAIEQVRDSLIKHFPIRRLEGIATFPSYHTVMAICFIHAYRGERYFLVLVGVLNVLMLLSTPTYGGHYLVDMIAGAVVAVGSITFVRYMQKIIGSAAL